ncbi:putative sugar phosphate/phosphate translocator [Trifolium pratense]|uniref:Putative sugar phosphate/phosphate translocator n=1 Tax=Trifolium pratense TaxID=57577 RepID=A0A2K3NZZ5_TRIPR|nr:putative sugar phosphate/phosphate translocator [Trifolium pratense]
MAVMATIMNRQHLLTYIYLLVYISLSSGVILYNKWVLSTLYFNFPFPITLTMIHMAFSGGVAFFLIRVLKVVAPIKMTFHIYITCVVPISAFFAASLWFGNTAYLYISVAFIQMLKALMPVATFLVAVTLGTEKLRCDVFWNMVLVSVGVVISSYGEIHFNVLGTVYQVSGIAAEALRLVLTQVLLQNKGLTLNPITSLYYIAPCRQAYGQNAAGYDVGVELRGTFLGYICIENVNNFVFLFIPWYILEKPEMEAPHMEFNFWIFFSNALCALALNFSTFLVIGRTGAVTIRVAGVLKDWLLISLSTVLFPESKITGLNVIGYAIALSGVVCYNYLKIRDVRRSQLQINPDESAKELLTEKKGDDDNDEDIWNNSVSDSHHHSHFDEEAPLMYSSRISHLGRKPA